MKSKLLLFLIGINCLASAQSALQRAITDFAADPALKHAGVSISVIDAKTGKWVAGHRASQGLAPASSLKVLTTATALAVLGDDYTFRTELQYDGEIDSDGVLNGNLYLRGSGDPTYGSDQMEGAANLEEAMARLRLALQQRGVRRITGYIIADASCFDTEVSSPTWHWIDMGNYYGAGAWGLNIHENLYHLHFRQTAKVGDTPGIALIEPDMPDLVFNNEVSSAGENTGDNAYIYGAPYTYERYVRGAIPAGRGTFAIKGSMPDAPLFAARYLDQQLRSVGIVSAKGPATLLELTRKGFKPVVRQTLYTHYSPPLSAIIKRTNIQSVNLYCEAMLRAVGLAKQQEGSANAGMKTTLEFWKNQGVDTKGVFLEDGCGLSAHNAVPSLFLAQVLHKVYNNPKWYRVIDESLPVAGQSGGLKGMLKGTAAEGRLRAKTGTLDRVRSFTGYAPDSKGRQLAFSLIVSNYTCSGSEVRKKMETVMRAMCE